MDSQELANYVIQQQINYNQKIIFFVSILVIYLSYYLLSKKYKEDFFVVDILHKILTWSFLPVISFVPLYVLLLDNGFDFYILSDYISYIAIFFVATIPVLFLTGFGEKIYKFIKEDLLEKLLNYYYGGKR